MKKTGKDFYRYSIVVAICLICSNLFASDGGGLSGLISEMNSLSAEQILFREKDYDLQFRERYLLGVEKCRSVGEASEEAVSSMNSQDQDGINQGICFEGLVEYKKSYSLIKYESRKKIMIEANKRSLRELEKVQEAKIKLIQRSSPEEIAPFEL